MTKEKKNFAVAIVGAGVTGLSARYHLEKNGITDSVLFAAGPTESSRTPGYLHGGQRDNFTRVVTAHGEAFAKELWRFGNRSSEAVHDFLKQSKLAHSKGRKWRLIVSDDELKEAKEAVEWLNRAGFKARLLLRKDGPENLWSALSPRVLAVQEEEGESSLVNPGLLEKALRDQASGTIKNEKVTALDCGGSGARLRTESGKEYTAQLVILAAHLEIARFIPTLEEALVPVADQWLELELTAALPGVWSQAGTCFSAFHGYEWGCVLGPKKMALGGGRFLRKLAGIGAKKAEVEEKVSQFLVTQFGKTWQGAGVAKVAKAQAGLDCWPCDELPVIGPMFGNDRVLLATGYMGSGLTMGFFAGRVLADYVRAGKSSDCPSLLNPARLRSLS